MQTVRELAYTYIVLGGIVLFSMTSQIFLMEKAASAMTKNLKIAWFKALLRQDIAYHDIMDVSGEATIITASANRYHKGVGRKLSESIQYSVTFFGGLAYAFWACWQVSLAVLGLAPLVAVFMLFLAKMHTSMTSRAHSGYSQAGAIVSTSITNIRTVLALNAVEIMIAKFCQKTSEAYHSAVSQVALLGLATGLGMSSVLCTYIVVAFMGAWLLFKQVKENGCDPSAAVVENPPCQPNGKSIFGSLMGITFSAMVSPQISVCIESFFGARIACYPALAVIRRALMSNLADRNIVTSNVSLQRGLSELPPYKIDSLSSTGKKLESVRGDIEFRNVSFHYPARKEIEVFNDVSLKIEAGKITALVGVSGCGKSTVLSLLERFYDPTEGSILLDGVDLRDLNIKWLRNQIGLVSQEPKLFQTSIRDNIGAGVPNATNKQIEAAARMANVHEFIESLPRKYDTDAGALGSMLSGGQKQRICIARCLMKKPKIILLDEATSALDTENEMYVQDSLDRLMHFKGMTTLVIAHRLSTIKNADLIYVMQDGRIVESGHHNDLLAKKSYYSMLVEVQERKKDSNQGQFKLDEEERHFRRTQGKKSLVNIDEPLVEFKDVNFEYPSRPTVPVLRGFNLQIKNGETLALIGPSGCGKSTVVQLIECFYRPTNGTIMFRGENIATLNVRWLRHQLGLVSQEPTLFDESIDENIRFSIPSASHEQVIAAAKLADAHDFIMQFPKGYHTAVGEGSTLISGGEKQRIAIARALIKKPLLLLLDEATSALDSKSEQAVQTALDRIMCDREQTCLIIAHRLSTIQKADRIAVFNDGCIQEIGTHDELLLKTDGIYKQMEAMQSLEANRVAEQSPLYKERNANATTDSKYTFKRNHIAEEITKKEESTNVRRARLLARPDAKYYFAGAIGSTLSSISFPAWGFVLAYMIELLYLPVLPCHSESAPFGFDTCEEYWDSVTNFMRERSFQIFFGLLGVIGSTMLGFVTMFWGFGHASERMNKRVRDAVFANILRQEVAWFDAMPPATLISRLSDDAAMLHSFVGEPIRTLVASLASVLVAIIVAFVYMWPFALLVLAVLPFMIFGAKSNVQMFYGVDEFEEEQAAHLPGGIVIESLTNIRLVASLTLEDDRVQQFAHALEANDPHPTRTNLIKGGTSGLGQALFMWGMGLMFWWGGWLLYNFPDQYTFRNFLIAMFSIFFCFYALMVASGGAVDKEKAKRAAERIFELTDRKSLIDPLSDENRFTEI